MHSLNQYPFEDTAFFISAITAALFIGICRKYLYDVLLNNTGHVFHATVTQL